MTNLIGLEVMVAGKKVGTITEVFTKGKKTMLACSDGKKYYRQFVEILDGKPIFGRLEGKEAEIYERQLARAGGDATLVRMWSQK